MRISLSVVFIAGFLFFHSFPSFAQFIPVYTCGNDAQNIPYGCDFFESMVGDPVNPYRGNLMRTVKDIETFGNAPIPFIRFYNSRTTSFNASYWDFGFQQTWQHNWNYEMRQLSSKTHGFFDIKLRYPNGQEYNFVASDESGEQLIPAADSGDRLYRWPGNVVGYTLITPAGREYHFQRVDSPKFRLLEVRNGTGMTWTLTHDDSGRIIRISNDFGRFLEIVREEINGVTRIASVQTNDGRIVRYGYSDWVPGSGQVLSSVTYPDGTAANYSWTGSDSAESGRPLLASASDPMLKDGDAVMSWTYNYSAIFEVEGSETEAMYLVTGTVLQERHPITGDIVLSLPGGGGPDPLIYEGDETQGTGHIRRKFENGLIHMKSDAEGRVTTFGRDNGGMGCVSSRTDPNGGTTSYLRDNVGRPTSVTDPLGNTESYVYNNSGFIVEHTDKRGNLTRYIRDAGNHVIRQENPDGSIYLATYNSFGQKLTATSALDGVTIYEYYGENEAGGMPGDLKSITDPVGHETTFTHDSAGRLISITDPLGRSTSYTYDWRGNILSVIYPDGSSTSKTYDVHGNPVTETDESGRTWIKTYNAFQRLATITDPMGNTTSFVYGRFPGDAQGLIRNTVALMTLPSGRASAWTYDATGLVLSETVGHGTAEAIATAYTYSSAGDLISITDGAGNVTAYSSDLLHRVTSISDPTDRITSFAYDASGNRTGVTRPDGLVESTVYDVMGRPVAKVDAAGGTTLLAYDAMGNLTSVTDPKGQTHTFAYDLKGRKTAMIYPDGTSESWTYDAAGDLSAHTSRSGIILSLIRDSRSREILRHWNDEATPAVATTYDASGRILNISTGNWDGSNMSDILATNTYAYDAAGRLLSETQALSGLASGTVSRTLDADGRVSSLTNVNGSTTSIVWNARGQMAAISENVSATPVVAYAYDAAGRRALRTLANGVNTSYSRDAAGRLTRLLSTNALDPLADFAQTYDAMGNVSSLFELQPNLPNRNRTLGHDALGQLTQDQDAFLADSAFSWTYDLAGNRTTTMHPEDGLTNWAADAANRYVAIGNETPLHDLDGNLSAHGDWTYDHDATGKLIGAASITSRIAIVRDGLGRPVLRQRYDWTSPAVVISQIYAAGGNTNATYKSDFVVLHNRSDDAVDLSGWSLQYAAATSDNWSATPLSGIIQAGGYYLIALHSGANGIDLPTPDKSGTSNFAVTGGKIALVSSTADLSGNCPADESIVDLIGYGTNVSCHWGDAPAVALNNAPQSALTRLNNGCHSLRDNAADFVLMNVSPQNSASTPEICDRWHLSESRALFYDDWNLVAEIDTATGNIIATYLHGADIDEIVAQKSGNSIAYYIADHLGSVRAITDANGNIVEHYRYEAFGQPTIFNADGTLLNSSALGNRFMFTGREYLPSIGLYDYRNRTYSPTMGRFIEVDPLRLSAGDLNMYRYVGNQPVDLTDPTGLIAPAIPVIIAVYAAEKAAEAALLIASAYVAAECVDYFIDYFIDELDDDVDVDDTRTEEIEMCYEICDDEYERRCDDCRRLSDNGRKAEASLCYERKAEDLSNCYSECRQ